MTGFPGFGYAWGVTGSPSAPGRAARLTYLDWARGLAVLGMINTHGVFAWTTPEDYRTRLFGLSRLAGGYPATLFLFLAGVSAALVAERERDKGADGAEVRRRGLRRGLTVLGYAFLFRAWMLASGGFGRWADLLKVDVLNCIAVSLLLVAVALGPATARGRVLACLGLAAAVALATPLVWDGAWWRGWPVPLAGYLTGRVPDTLFPVFPWAAYAAAGAVCGVVLARARAQASEGRTIALMAAVGAAAIPAALAADRHGPRLYPTYDFWYTSAGYVAIKTGVALVVFGLAYVMDKLPGPSALRQMGRTSLLIYWVHLEIVYGRWVAPALRGTLSIEQALTGVAVLALAMLGLSWARTSAGGWRLGGGALAKA
jgi:uncharacterized membrane protein